jgi:hypothetical protein
MIFFDKQQENQFLDKGFVVIPSVLTIQTINVLLDYHFSSNNQLHTGFKTSVWSDNKDYRKATFDLLKPIYDENLKDILIDHEGIMGNYMIKEPQAGSFIDIHADWCFTEEPEIKAINAWIPLVDTSIENGCLRILPYSNQFNYHLRGRKIIHQFEELKNLLEELSEDIIVKAGDLVLFNVACIHHSRDNLSLDKRPAVSMVMVPKKAKVIHYTSYDDTHIRKIPVNDPYFFSKYSAFDDIPTQPEEELIPLRRKQLGEKEFNKLYSMYVKPNSLQTKWLKLLKKHKRIL